MTARSVHDVGLRALLSMARGVMVAMLVGSALQAQTPATRRGLPAVDDTVRMLPGSAFTFDAFLQRVQRNHPVVRQARLLATGADGDVTSALGAFEPKLEASWETKRYGSTVPGPQTLYYNYADVALKIPTPFGPDFKIGYTRASGRFINPQLTTPTNGLFSAGFVLPLGQRLLTDERRNALRVARALRDVADAERTSLTNKLLYSAAKSYAEWYSTALQLQVNREGVQLAQTRYEAIVRRVRVGDAAGIDSIEAAAELNRRLAQVRGAEQGYFAATMDLTSYLWDARVQPQELSPGTVPSDSGLGRSVVDSASVPALLARVVAQHPEVLKAEGKRDQATADFALARQAVIPLATAELSALRAGGGSSSFEFGDALQRDANFKGSVDVSSPLLFFKERGKLQSADAKLDRSDLEARATRRDVTLLVRAALYDLSQFGAQLDLQREAVRLYRILSAGERARFDAGESTLFLVNTRERQVLDEELKYVTLQAKYLSARAALAVAAGVNVGAGERFLR
ncbi:MAG TPA: TolC family protein [Gemmatimonadaceae bacterium]|nr:TolC family protein [Gemmatimonadaceae bacterium]